MKKRLFNSRISGVNILLRIAIILIVGLTPLFINFLYPTNIDLSKLVFFKISVLLLLLASVWKFAKGVRVNKISGRLFLPLGALLLYLFINLLFSVDINSSWFGLYSRYEGMASWLFFILWSFLLLVNLESKQDVIKLLKVASISGLVVSIYAICQILGWDFLTWQEPAKITGRAFSTFGQPNYLACWLVIIIPFSAYLFYSQTSKTRFVWLAFTAMQLLALFFTGSRAASLIFIITSAAFVFFISRLNNRKSRRLLVKITLASVGVFLLFIGSLAYSHNERLAEFIDFKSGSMSVRLELWKGAFSAIKERPFFGYGLENQKESYFKAYQKDWAATIAPNAYANRAHNLILDVLMTTGLVGLLFFCYFIYSVFKNLVRSYQQQKDVLIIFIIWSLSVYLLALLFNFSVITTNIYFWLIIALSFYFSRALEVEPKNKQKGSLRQLAFIGAALSVFIYGFLVISNSLAADYYHQRSLINVANNKVFTALSFHNYLLSSHPNIASQNYYDRELSLLLISKLSVMDGTSRYITGKTLVDISPSFDKRQIENIFVDMVIKSTFTPNKQLNEDWRKLVSLSPQMPKLYVAWGNNLASLGDNVGAIEKFEQAISLLPNEEDPGVNQQHRRMIVVYKNLINAQKERIKNK